MSSPVGTDTSLPVHILTGFLGSGKTTLLNRLLATADGFTLVGWNDDHHLAGLTNGDGSP